MVILKKYDEFPEKYDISNFPRVYALCFGKVG